MSAAGTGGEARHRPGATSTAAKHEAAKGYDFERITGAHADFLVAK